MAFKATCAAFINSDIRSALQEGYAAGRGGGARLCGGAELSDEGQGIAGGGAKVFLQGGVALNRAVACALRNAWARR